MVRDLDQRYYAFKHEDGSWQVDDQEKSSVEPRWAPGGYWDAIRTADHLNGKHETERAKCDLCQGDLMMTKSRARNVVAEMRANLRYIEAEIRRAGPPDENFSGSELEERLNEIDGDSALLREFFDPRSDH